MTINQILLFCFIKNNNYHINNSNIITNMINIRIENKPLCMYMSILYFIIYITGAIEHNLTVRRKMTTVIIKFNFSIIKLYEINYQNELK